MVGIFVGNTDNNWFDTLSRRFALDEVNFWRPSEQGFGAIQGGEILAFRLRSPRQKIAGYGVLAETSVLPIQTAWDAFGEKNGVHSLEELVSAIGSLRPGDRVTPSTFIGCRVLVEPVFFHESEWFDPPSWSRQIVGGKRFDTETDEGRRLWDQLLSRSQAGGAPREGGFDPAPPQAPRFGSPTLISPRLGQGAFRVAITELYRRQCALTGGKVLPALDAAHIRPYREGGVHAKSNGILLRKDIHSIFDAGYATIDTNYRFVVSDRVRDVFNNGEEYRRLQGVALALPPNPLDHPDRAALAWHNDNRFEK